MENEKIIMKAVKKKTKIDLTSVLEIFVKLGKLKTKIKLTLVIKLCQMLIEKENRT